MNLVENKTVLLRERKKHTTRCVASHVGRGEGYLPWLGSVWVPTLVRGYLHWWVPPPMGVDRQTPVKAVPSHRRMYAGDKSQHLSKGGSHSQGGHGTGKTGNLVLTFSRQGKHREFCCNTGKIFETQGNYF